jgi:hypothetical protein
MHTHPYEYTHANPTPRSIFEDCRQIFKIDEVATGAPLSTGMSPTTESTNAVRS